MGFAGKSPSSRPSRRRISASSPHRRGAPAIRRGTIGEIAACAGGARGSRRAAARARESPAGEVGGRPRAEVKRAGVAPPRGGEARSAGAAWGGVTARGDGGRRLERRRVRRFFLRQPKSGHGPLARAGPAVRRAGDQKMTGRSPVFRRATDWPVARRSATRQKISTARPVAPLVPRASRWRPSPRRSRRSASAAAPAPRALAALAPDAAAPRPPRHPRARRRRGRRCLHRAAPRPAREGPSRDAARERAPLGVNDDGDDSAPPPPPPPPRAGSRTPAQARGGPRRRWRCAESSYLAFDIAVGGG